VIKNDELLVPSSSHAASGPIPFTSITYHVTTTSVCQEHTCRRFFHGKLEQSWKRFGQIVLKSGYRWYGKARVWQEETLETYVSLVWDIGCEEPWLLISDQGAGRRQVQE
jgi:hypothetical protein